MDQHQRHRSLIQQNSQGRHHYSRRLHQRQTPIQPLPSTPNLGTRLSDLPHTIIGTNTDTTITHSNQTTTKRLHTVTIRQKGRKVSIDKRNRLRSSRADGAVPSRSNREPEGTSSGRGMDRLIHRIRRPSKATIEVVAWLGAIIVWSTIWYIALNMIMVLNG